MTLTHLNERGEASMVDVADKDLTRREAVASGRIYMQPETLERLLDGDLPKGDVLATARIAGIQAAKRTHELIPLCHALMLSKVGIDFEPDFENHSIGVRAFCRLSGQTGVEMEALTAVSVACLTLYDMCKAIDRGMEITEVRLLHKSGGRSGVWTREESPESMPSSPGALTNGEGAGDEAADGESIGNIATAHAALDVETTGSAAADKAIEVRFFAELREQLGLEKLSVLPGHLSSPTLSALKEWLRGQVRHPEALDQPRLLCAVNHEMVQKSRVLEGGDEVAFFPPVTGG